MKNRKFYFEWHSVVRDILRNVLSILCAAAISLMGTYIVKHLVYSAVYTSSASLIINSAAGKANAVASLSQNAEIAKIYTEVFVQPSMKEKACEYLNFKSFDGTIKASVSDGTNIMELSVSASDPENAYKELCAILKVYPKLTSSLFTNGAVSILKTPALPKSPSNSITRGNLTRNAILGMIVMIIAIAAISITRDTVKNEAAFEDKVDSHLIGTIPHQAKHLTIRQVLKHEKRGLLIDGSAFMGLKFSENFSKIAFRIEYAKKTKGESVFCVTSVAENEGKSTISANIALALAEKGNSVILMDLDGKRPALYKLFNEKRGDDFELLDLISGDTSPDEFMFRRYKKTSLFLALNTEFHSDYQQCIEDGNVEKVIGALKKMVDFIIIDTAPCSVDASVTGTAAFCDETILVVRTDTVYTPIINDTLLTLENTGAKVMGCVLNDCYEEVSVLGQLGTDEAGYSFSGLYGGYGRYSKYEKYGKYGKYSKYSRYGRYGKYDKYGRYSRYSALKGHGDSDSLDDLDNIGIKYNDSVSDDDDFTIDYNDDELDDINIDYNDDEEEADA